MTRNASRSAGIARDPAFRDGRTVRRATFRNRRPPLYKFSE